MDNENEDKVARILQQREEIIDDVLAKVGFGKVQFVMVIGCGLMVMATVMETAGAAHITVPLACAYAISTVGKSFLKAATFLGMVFSAFFWSFLCDRYGRRTILIYSMVISTPISFLSTLMPDYYSYLTFRILVGVFVSGPNFVCVTYLTEFCPRTMIAVVANSMAMFNGIAMALWPAMAKEILRLKIDFPIGDAWQYAAWRLLGTLYLLPGLGGLFIIAFLPESPKYLAFQSKRKSLGVLSWLCKQNRGQKLDYYVDDKKKCIQIFDENLGDWNMSFRHCCSEISILCHESVLRHFGTICLLNFVLSSM